MLVADVRRERRDDADASLHQLAAALLVGGDAGDAVVHKRVDGVGQRADGLEQTVENDRLKGVQLELPALRRHRDGHVVADDEERHLVDDLRNDRIHLARHDGRAVLPRREVDLAEAGARTGRHEPEIVRNLRERHGAGLDGARDRDERVRVLRGVDEIGRLRQRHAGNLAQNGDDPAQVCFVGVDARGLSS